MMVDGTRDDRARVVRRHALGGAVVDGVQPHLAAAELERHRRRRREDEGRDLFVAMVRAVAVGVNVHDRHLAEQVRKRRHLGHEWRDARVNGGELLGLGAKAGREYFDLI